jgi:hypothetical protein
MNQMTSTTKLRYQDLAALAVDFAGIGIWEIVVSSGVWRCSPRSKELLGVGEAADPIDALCEDDRRRFTEAITRAVRDGAYYLEIRVRERWFAASGRVVIDSSGVASSIVGTLQDITGHRTALEVCLGEVGLEIAKPLAIVRLGVHLVRQGSTGPELLTGMDEMVAAIQRIATELINFSRSRPSVFAHVVSLSVANRRPLVGRKRPLVG